MNNFLDLENIFFPYKLMMYPKELDLLANGFEVNPINIEINLTNKCNHKCKWCTYGYLRNENDELSTKTVEEILIDAKKLGVKSVTWTGGGEPSVHRDFLSCINIAARLGFKQGLNTNGELLTDRVIDCIAEHFSYVRFSVDAASEESFEKCHGINGSRFTKVVENIKKISKKRRTESNLILGYSYLVDYENIENLEKGVKLARDCGADYIQIKPVVYYEKSNEQFSVKSKLWNVLSAKLKTIKLYENKNFKVLVLQHKFDNIKLQEDYGRNYKKCIAHQLFISIGANGSVDLCCAFKGIERWSFGNVNANRLYEIWNSSKRKKVIDSINILECPPMCKADESNRLVNFISNFRAHKEFI